MANHGYCKNCWWWQKIDDNGICYMQPLDIGYKQTTMLSYCPDYFNRKIGNKKETLEDYIKSNKI